MCCESTNSRSAFSRQTCEYAFPYNDSGGSARGSSSTVARKTIIIIYLASQIAEKDGEEDNG